MKVNTMKLIPALLLAMCGAMSTHAVAQNAAQNFPNKPEDF